ncbi:FKBP12-associated protein [Sporothrix stenoceras]|uniref:FKBP12-associated protein n=1 Tax=Sporothrix stenoceras TaxID=5173 RepID=A0ABR3YZV3_9PEZI
MSAPRPGLNPEATAQDSTDLRPSAARGRRQRGGQNDAGRGRGRGRNGRPAVQDGPVAQQRQQQQQPPQQSEQPTQQPAQQVQPPAQPPAHGRGRGRGGLTRGSRGGRGGGSLIAPPRMFGNQLSGSQPASVPEGQVLPNGPANGNDTPSQPSRNARRRAARAAAAQAAASEAASEAGSVASYGAPKGPPSLAPDMPTRMHEDIDSGNYDCPICLNAVTRGSKIWACSMCYHVAHFACVSAWVKQALNQGLAIDKIRCPACNTEAAAASTAANNETENSGGGAGFFGRKLCWCGKQKAAGIAPPALPPHSCGRICGRGRADCHHTCPNPCHAGPCPPCTEMGPLITCFCGKETSIKPCAAGAQRSWICGAVCDNTLACRTHKCRRTCHPDDCGACTVPMPSTCFCGKTQQDVPCKDREHAQTSANYGQLVYGGAATSSFEGTFKCDTVCGRAFDCGKHFCKKPCHAQDASPAHCPTSPDVITHCLCGKTLLSSAGAPARTSCEDPIPACDKVCDKIIKCGHACPETCHAGACPPCLKIVDASCNCGQMTSPVVCSDRAAHDNVQCETVCRSWLSCKQHRCNIVCCPGKPKAAARMKMPKRRNGVQGSTAQEEIEAEHTCLRPCGRLLKCGQHTCPQVCHKGACHSCVAYILEDMSCPCGQTVVQAPYLCGTVLPSCDADCPRPLPCGHPSIPHRCHDSQQQPCPRCQRLVSKSCLCGKLVLNRVACGADNIQCSNICGKTLKCGVHTCRLPCHAEGKCEETTDTTGEGAAVTTVCSQVCGRPKATCGHPCANPCHGADDVCSETDPCGAAIEVTCPCQRQTRKVRCNVSASDPTPTYRRPECDDECLRIQRNAQLKDALRISDDYKDEHLVYSTALMEYFMANRAFATAQEVKIRSFFGSSPSTPAEPASTTTSVSASAVPTSNEKACIFRPMKRHERQFLHLLAESFNLRSESRDEEPHRYVFLTRPRTGTPAVPNISLAESEEIYLRLRDKAKAEADEREAEAALAASLKLKEATQEAAAARNGVDATRPADRSERKRPFNAIFVPAALAATVAANSGKTAKTDGDGDSTATPTILDNDAFQTIVEAWHEQQQQQRRWALSPGLGSSSSLNKAATLNQHTVEPSGDVILRVLIQATPPAVVEQLLVFLLSYMNAWWSTDTDTDEKQLALCHVDAQYSILRMGKKSMDNTANSDDDDQWNIVAGTSSASRQDSAVGTPVNGGVGSPPTTQQPPLSTKRVVFKLRQKQKTASMTTAAAEAERKRWMAILAQQATEEEKEEEVEEEVEDQAVNEPEVEKEGEEVEKTQEVQKAETKETEDTEELRTALEQAFIGEESAPAS